MFTTTNMAELRVYSDAAADEIERLRRACEYLWKESPRRMDTSLREFIVGLDELAEYHKAAEYREAAEE